jgi:phosphoglycolate phosphatase-like HAD superfamily hydrolase
MSAQPACPRRDSEPAGGSPVTVPDILALDFDGVLCEGSHEYFETSRRTYARLWPDDPRPGDERLQAFRALRPVIETGWEMPLLLRAIVQGEPEGRIHEDWAGVRARLLQEGRPSRESLLAALRETLDDVRRQWIAADAGDWVGHHRPYASLDELRRLVAEPAATVIVTTKEGEFCRRILDAWGLHPAGIEGKESGSHKCDNLRRLLAGGTDRGGRPRLWFVEDRLETLEHVATHDDLADVGLFLAAWGYNTPATRRLAARTGRIRLLVLDAFRRGPRAWP